MKHSLTRVLVCAAAVALATGCDTAASGPLASVGGGGKKTPTPPSVSIDSLNGVAVTSSNTIAIGVGDSLRVSVHLRASTSLGPLAIAGWEVTGTAQLGTLDSTQRYAQVVAPVGGGNFPVPTRDTMIIRYLKPAVPVDTTAGTLRVEATGTDTAGVAATAIASVQITAGPRVTVELPGPTDSATAGLAMTVTVSVSNSAGLTSLGFRVQGSSTWPTKLDTTFNQTNANLSTGTFTALVTLPPDAPAGSSVTITPFATANGQAASANARVVVVKAKTALAPHVTQEVPSRAELTDSVHITASGNGIKTVGFVASDSTGKVLRTDSVVFTAPFAVKVGPTAVPLGLAAHPELQGKRILVTSFAVDQDGLRGFSVAATSTASQTDATQAFADTLLVSYGQTFSAPRTGLMGDLIVDGTRGNVFLSNTNFNRLEIWKGATRTFSPSGISVGSLPWGMTLDNSGDTLLVANSGGTNISKVDVRTSLAEVESARLLTRSTQSWKVTQSIDATSGKITITIFEPPVAFSDRPQYLAESKAGRLFYSTRPTTNAPQGTIRWLDPKAAIPDPDQIYQYGTFTGDTTVYAVMNADSVKFSTGLNGISLFTVCDHTHGGSDTGTCAQGATIQDAIHQDSLNGGDAIAIGRLDLSTLGLTDTTFVATSGDRSWVAFGEGDTKGSVGRIMMANDVSGSVPGFFSPSIPVQDLLNNASESVSGLALDATGQTVAARGASSYFATVNNPFHLRLQGVYDSFSKGAGIAFDPKANGLTTPASDRLAFVASANGSIEIVDIVHYVNRGTLPIKANLYGPLRASLPFPGDPPDVVLKLFGLTSTGLVVIDLRAGDILPAP